MATKFQKGLADRIQMKKRSGMGYIIMVLAVLIGLGMFLSPTQWYWGIGFVVFFLIAFVLRMETWKIANEPLELIAFVLPTLIMIAILFYLYFQERLDLGVIIQIIVSAPFSIILARKLFADKVNEIVTNLRKRFNNI